MMLIGGSIRKDEGVEYLEFEMNDNESAPPRMVEKSTTWTISARLLSDSSSLGGGAKPSVFGGGLQSVGTGDCCCGGCYWHIPSRVNIRPRLYDAVDGGGGDGAGLRAKAMRIQG